MAQTRSPWSVTPLWSRPWVSRCGTKVRYRVETTGSSVQCTHLYQGEERFLFARSQPRRAIDPSVNTRGTSSNELEPPSFHTHLHAEIWGLVGEGELNDGTARSRKIIILPALTISRYQVSKKTRNLSEFFGPKNELYCRGKSVRKSRLLHSKAVWLFQPPCPVAAENGRKLRKRKFLCYSPSALRSEFQHSHEV